MAHLAIAHNFRPETYYTAEAAKNTAITTAMLGAITAAGVALRVLTSEAGFWAYVGGGIGGTAQYLGGIFFAALAVQLTSYILERSIDENKYSGVTETAIIIAKYALPMIVAAAVYFSLSFGLSLYLTIGISTLIFFNTGRFIAKVRDEDHPDYHHYHTLLSLSQQTFLSSSVTA